MTGKVNYNIIPQKYDTDFKDKGLLPPQHPIINKMYYFQTLGMSFFL